MSTVPASSLQPPAREAFMDDGLLTTAFQVFVELLNGSSMTVDISTDDTVEKP